MGFSTGESVICKPELFRKLQNYQPLSRPGAPNRKEIGQYNNDFKLIFPSTIGYCPVQNYSIHTIMS